MRNQILTIGLAVAAAASVAQTNAAVSWVDWSTTSTGTLTIPGGPVTVGMTGNALALVNGDYYYNNANTGYTAPSGTYGGLAPSDLIQVNVASTFTLNFSKPVVDPYIALVSVGQPTGNFVTYSFQNPFTVISYGPNYWGYNGYVINGNDITGHEFNGVLKLTGTFNSLSFTVKDPEDWHGFNVGAVSAVPEPSTYLAGITALGMLGLFGWRNRK